MSGQPEGGADLVQCGWCPVIMIYDMTVILLHFAVDHDMANGNYSLRHNIRGPDWGMAELDGSGS